MADYVVGDRAGDMLRMRRTTSRDLGHVVAAEEAPDTAVWLGETGRAWHERALTDPDQEHLVAETAGRLVGFVVLAGLRHGQGTIELRRMVMVPESRRVGRGRALLREALARAYDHHGARRVRLDVKVPNLRARTLYESEGFVLTRTPPGAAANDLVFMDHTR